MPKNISLICITFLRSEASFPEMNELYIGGYDAYGNESQGNVRLVPFYAPPSLQCLRILRQILFQRILEITKLPLRLSFRTYKNVGLRIC